MMRTSSVVKGVTVPNCDSGILAASRLWNTQPMSVTPCSTLVSVAFIL